MKQITSISKMLKSSFPFCDSDQIAMSSRNVQTSLFRFFRRDAFFFYFYFFSHFQNIYITNTDITQQEKIEKINALVENKMYKHDNKWCYIHELNL
jgi:hypothetical protein